MLRSLLLLVMVLAFPHLPSAVAATPSYTCPVCSDGPLHCQRTMPDESTGQHPLENMRGRVSGVANAVVHGLFLLLLRGVWPSWAKSSTCVHRYISC